ncbi:MAG: YHS domain-containing (seleno)protein [Planctomycetota bacterium]
MAIGCYDPVAYFTEREPMEGDFTVSSTHHGAQYWFVSEEHKAMFDANPDHYAPQYGGYCAFGAAIAKKFNGDPLVWAVIDDKLYLNINEYVAEKLNDDQAGFIEKADAKWPEIKNVPADEIE